MQHFKEKNGKLHALEPQDVEAWAQPEWEQVTDAEADAIRAAQKPQVDRRAVINARLSQIDAESIRAMRAAARGKAVKADTDKLDALETEAAALRAELAAMR